MKWKKLTNLPAPLYNAYAVMQQNRIYVAGGYSPVDIAMQTVYVYELHTDCWKQLPLLDHYCAVAHIIGGRLTLIGGRLCSSNESTNKVSTFDESTHTWTSYYPDLLSARYRPGVVAYLDHVIVAGGRRTAEAKDIILDDIEVLNWTENLQWKKISLILPQPMYAFTPITCGEHIMIIGCWLALNTMGNSVFQLSIAHNDIVGAISERNVNHDHWTQLTSVPQCGWRLAPIPLCGQPTVVGGLQDEISTPDMKVYDCSDDSWKVIGSLYHLQDVQRLQYP